MDSFFVIAGSNAFRLFYNECVFSFCFFYFDDACCLFEQKKHQQALKQRNTNLEQDGDTEHLMLALRTVAEAQGGVPELARKINMEKMTLYKALSEKGNPRLSTIYSILKGLGYRLLVEPFEEHQARYRAN